MENRPPNVALPLAPVMQMHYGIGMDTEADMSMKRDIFDHYVDPGAQRYIDTPLADCVLVEEGEDVAIPLRNRGGPEEHAFDQLLADAGLELSFTGCFTVESDGLSEAVREECDTYTIVPRGRGRVG